MSEEEKIILTEEQISRYAAAFDGAVNFKKFNIKFRFLGIFKIDVGSILENVDGKIFAEALKLLNTFYQNGKISEDVAELLKAIFENIDSSDETNLTKVIMQFIFEKTSSVGEVTKETLTATAVAIAGNFNTLLDQFNEKIDELIAAAE